MYGKLTRVLAAAILTIGVASTTAALAQTNAPAAPPQQAPSPMQGQGMQGQGMMGGQGTANGQGMMGGGGNMMEMMGAMTRMANTCNSMMESANHGAKAPAKPSTGPSHG